MALKHWDGVLSPRPFMSKSLAAFSLSDTSKISIKRAFSVSYGSTVGGVVRRSMTRSAVFVSSIVRACANLVLEHVICLMINWASAWVNQSSALFGQKGGSFRDTCTISAVLVAAATAASLALYSSSLSSRACLMASFICTSVKAMLRKLNVFF